MTKRIFSLALCCVVLVISLAVPSYAAEVWEDDVFFDVLSYSTPNDSGSMVCMVSNNKLVANFALPEGRYIRYIDFIIQIATNDVFSSVTVGTSATSTQKALTVVELGSQRFRIYGQYSQYSPNICITVNGSPLRAVTFDSFRISYQSFTTYDETGTCEISALGYNAIINYVPTDLINYRTFTGSSDYEGNGISCWAQCPNWRKYDYLDFLFSMDIGGINSVNVTLGDSIVPCEVSYLSSNGVNDHYAFSVRIDLRNVKRTSTESLIVSIHGKVNSGIDNIVSVDGIRGYIDAGDVNILYVFLRDIITGIANIKSALNGNTSSGDAFKEDSSGLISGLDNISSSMDAVQRPSMDSINADYSGDISDASVLMANLFSEVTGAAWVSRIILASITIGLISYILYGKD